MRLISAGSAVRVRPPAPAFARASPSGASAGRPAAPSVRRHAPSAGGSPGAHHDVPVTNLAAQVRRSVERQQLWPPGARVVAAVSGGADSVALAAPAARARGRRRPRCWPALAHLNHQLRAPRPTATRRSAARSRARLGVPLRRRPRGRRGRWRAAARRRSRWRRAAPATRSSSRRASARAAHAVAVAHTARRSGRDGAAAAAARRRHPRAARRSCRRAARIVRPLLDVRARRAAADLAARGESWRRGRDQRRPRASAQPHPPRAAAAAGRATTSRAVARVLARTAELAPRRRRLPEQRRRTPPRRSSRPSRQMAAVVRRADLAGACRRRSAPRRAAGTAAGGATRAAAVSPTSSGCWPSCRATPAAGCRVAGVTVERFSADAVLFSQGRAAGAPAAAAAGRSRCRAWWRFPNWAPVGACGPTGR